MIFSELFETDTNFQSSVNIYLDLNNIEKINSYIPTKSSVNFLNYYLDNISGKGDDKSTMVIAPYGKGKSHLILVLLYIISHSDYDDISVLLNKIKYIDNELYDKILKYKNRKLMPIIVSNTRGTLSQALCYSLKKSLIKYDILDINLDTDYDQAISRLLLWKNDYSNTYDKFALELKSKYHITVKKLLNNLREYDDIAMNQFCEIHKSILSGIDFISSNSMEVVDYYQEISEKITTEYDYSGIFVVFDEFSKFLESRDPNTVTNDMKIIQDLAELSNGSKNVQQVHLQLVLHKPIGDYLSMNHIVRNAFKGIEGRVKEYYLRTTLTNTFELVYNVIKKNQSYESIKEMNNDLYNYISYNISKLPVFYSEFELQNIRNEMLDGCYPLHPISAYLLVRISEKVAQNERTLFTFLAKNSPLSLNQICKKEYEFPLLLPTVIYDYFEELLLNEKDNPNLHRIIINAKTALSLTKDFQHKQFIKCLALILIVNNNDDLPSNVSVVSQALMISENDCIKMEQTLIKNGIIVKRKSGQLEFKINMNLDLNATINNVINTKFNKINIINELSNIYENNVQFPRNYNTVNHITRFYKIDFIEDYNFLSFADFKYYFEKDYRDGLILFLIKGEDDLSDDVIKKIEEIEDDRVIVFYPNQFCDFSSDIRRYLAVNYLLNDDYFIDENLLIKKELEIILEELKEEINEKINQIYTIEHNKCLIYHASEGEICVNSHLSWNRNLGEILDFVYPYTPKVNLELINKSNVKSVYKKAREHVVQQILNGTIQTVKLGTSPDNTIINCVLRETGLYDEQNSNCLDVNMDRIVSVISDFFNQSSGSFRVLYSILLKPPYGLRKGLLPILIAYSLKKTNLNYVIYFKDYEVSLNAQTLEKINDNYEDYSFVLDELSIEKNKYLTKLEKLFNTNNYQENRYSNIYLSMQQWYNSLPKIAKSSIGTDEYSNIKYKVIQKSLTKSNQNPYQFLLKLPSLIGDNSFDETIKDIESIKITLDSIIDNYYNEIRQYIVKVLNYNDVNNLNSILKHWYTKNLIRFDQKILSSFGKKFLSDIKSSEYENEKSTLSNIAYTFTSLFIEDWSVNTVDIFKEKFKQEIEDILEIENNDKDEIVISINDGKKDIFKSIECNNNPSFSIIKNELEDVFDNFGDLLTEEEKVAILIEMIKKYI